MIKYLIAFAFLAAVIAVQTEDGVIVLTDSDFDRYTRKQDLILVLFYMPSCIYCQDLWPKYVEAGKQLAEKNIPIAKVLISEEKLNQKYNVQSYPTLMYFK